MNILVQIERALLGTGWCYRCERPWKTQAKRRTGPNSYFMLNREKFWGLIGVEPHETRYKERSSCFPLCERCWSELGTVEARLPYYRMLAYSWLKYPPRENEIPGMILGLIREELA